MIRTLRWSKSLGFIVMVMMLSSCFASMGTKQSKIPVFKASKIYTTNKYFDVIGKYKDRGLAAFNSAPGLSADLANKAAAEGASAYLETKAYKQYVNFAIPGTYTFVEGIGIKWKSAGEKTLLSDLKRVIENDTSLAKLQRTQLFNLIKKQNIKNAIPMLRKAMKQSNLNKKMMKIVTHAYTNLIDRSETPYLVKLVGHQNDSVRATAIFALSKYGTKKHAPVFLKLTKSNKKAYSYSAAKALKRVAGTSYRAEWEKLFKYHSNSDVRLIAAEALLSQNQRKVVEQEAGNVSDRRLQASLNRLLMK